MQSEIANWWKKAAEQLIRIFFPVQCLVCKMPGFTLCANCFAKRILRTPWSRDKITSLTSYGDPIIRKSIWLLKYGNCPDVAETFGRALHEAIVEDLAEEKLFAHREHKILVIPIPLSKERLRTRGYNHVGRITRALVSCAPESYEDSETVLIKIRDTKPQMTLSKKERLTNLKDAFALRKGVNVHRREILLVDDVTTTGATILEAKKVLLASGAKKVNCITVAH